MTKSNNYLRQIGIAENQFTLLFDKLELEIKQDLHINKMKNRGVSSKAMTTELKLLLTLNYLRHYPTFSNLGAMFGISESYANKIFHKTIDYLLKFIHPKKTNELSLDDVCTGLCSEAPKIWLHIIKQCIKINQNNTKYDV